jgi:fatty-acyl-CoA synthase
MTPDIGLANWFRQRALRSPERKALHFEGRMWTYADMQREIEDCAARLAELGVGKGERVAFLGLNQPMFSSSCLPRLGLGRYSYRSISA